MGEVVKATGVVKPEAGAEVRLGTQVTGRLSRVNVQVGDRVQRGQILFELDARQPRARYDQALAAVRSAEVNQRFAAADLRRKQELFVAGVASRSELEPSERALALAEAALAETQARLELAGVILTETQIRAPISGVVASLSAWEGELAIAGPTAAPLVTLLAPEKLEVWAYVDEIDIARIAPDQEASFTVDALPKQELTGRVEAVRPLPEIRDNVVNYVAVIRFTASAEPPLRPEMTAAVQIRPAPHDRTLVVPRRAVHREGGRTYVRCPEGGLVVRREVTLGARDESYWEVESGLAGDDLVLVGEASALNLSD
jgi:RND family efflux transporter MFP subunit